MDPKKRLSFLMYCIPISFTNCNRFWWWIPKTVINRHVFYLCTFCTVITNYMWYIIILPFFRSLREYSILNEKEYSSKCFSILWKSKKNIEKYSFMLYTVFSNTKKKILQYSFPNSKNLEKNIEACSFYTPSRVEYLILAQYANSSASKF